MRGRSYDTYYTVKTSCRSQAGAVTKKIARTLKCGEDTFSYEIVRQSLDARHKEDKKFVYTVDVSTLAEKKMLRKNRDKNVTFFEKKEYCFPKPGEEVLKNPPVVVGSGPAGVVSRESRLSSAGTGTRTGGTEA